MAGNLLSLAQIKHIVAKKVGYEVKWVDSAPSEDGQLAKTGFHALVPETEDIVGMLYQEDSGFDIFTIDGSGKVHTILWNSEIEEIDGVRGVLITGALNGIVLIDDVIITKAALESINLYDIAVTDNGATTVTSTDNSVEFYYNANHEGVVVDGKNYRFMVDLPRDFDKAVNALMIAFHQHREKVMKRDKYMNPIT